jgi:hypothetical protein
MPHNRWQSHASQQVAEPCLTTGDWAMPHNRWRSHASQQVAEPCLTTGGGAMPQNRWRSHASQQVAEPCLTTGGRAMPHNRWQSHASQQVAKPCLTTGGRAMRIKCSYSLYKIDLPSAAASCSSLLMQISIFTRRHAIHLAKVSEEVGARRESDLSQNCFHGTVSCS